MTPDQLPPQTQAGGIWCGEVLEALPAFIADELDETTGRVVRAHLRECAWCETFGGEYATVVKGLRDGLAQAEELHTAVIERLNRRLSDERES